MIDAERTEEKMFSGVPGYWDGEVVLVSHELGFGVRGMDITRSHPIKWSGSLRWGGEKM